MKLYIENIGKIKHAEITLNGITVLAGENNTGKSTVGKVLYCLFNSCFNIDGFIIKQRLARARREIDNIIMSNIRFNQDYETEKFIDNFRFHGIDSPAFLKVYEENTIDSILFYLKQTLSEETLLSINSIDDVASSIKIKIKEIKNISQKQLKISRVGNIFGNVFNDQFVSIDQQEGSVTGEIKGNSVVAEFNALTCTNLTLDFIFTNQALLLDTPSILDDFSVLSYNRRNRIKVDLIRKLSSDKCPETEDVDSTIAAHKLSKLYDLLDDVVPGNFLTSEQSRDKTFLFKGMPKPIKLGNLSQGIKSFLIIKRLCENGQFKEKDVLILDEPEINLHPSWQLIYAEIIVLLQKEYNLTILLSTHSPYFLSAIEAFSKKHNISDKCKYYLSENIGNYAFFTDVTNNLETIYEKLSKPFDILAEVESEGNNG